MKLTFMGEYPAKLKYDLEKLGFVLSLSAKIEDRLIFECEPPCD